MMQRKKSALKNLPKILNTNLIACDCQKMPTLKKLVEWALVLLELSFKYFPIMMIYLSNKTIVDAKILTNTLQYITISIRICHWWDSAAP